MEHTPLTSKTKISSSIGNNEVEYFRNQIRSILPEELGTSYEHNNAHLQQVMKRISEFFDAFRQTHRHCLGGMEYLEKLQMPVEVVGKYFVETIASQEDFVSLQADWKECFEGQDTKEIIFWRRFFKEIFEVFLDCAHVNSEEHQGVLCLINDEFQCDTLPQLPYNILSLDDDGWFYGNYFEEFIKNFDSQKVNSLNLQFQNFGLIPDDKIQFLFQNLPNLTNINLYHNTLFSDVPEKFDSLFHGMQSIRHLSIDETQLWHVDAEALKKYFGYLTSLKSILLKGFSLKNIGNERLSIISQSLSGLQALDLTDVELYYLGRNDAKALFSGFGNLKYLGIVCDPIDTLDPEVLQAMFQPLQSLQELNLIACRIAYMTTEQLNEIFSPLQNLKKINFGGNDFSKCSPGVRKHFFGLLSGVEIIHFGGENFNNYTRSDFREIFLPLKNAKEIHLSLTKGMKEVILQHCPELNPDCLIVKF